MKVLLISIMILLIVAGLLLTGTTTSDDILFSKLAEQIILEIYPVTPASLPSAVSKAYTYKLEIEHYEISEELSSIRDQFYTCFNHLNRVLDETNTHDNQEIIASLLEPVNIDLYTIHEQIVSINQP